MLYMMNVLELCVETITSDETQIAYEEVIMDLTHLCLSWTPTCFNCTLMDDDC